MNPKSNMQKPIKIKNSKTLTAKLNSIGSSPGLNKITDIKSKSIQLNEENFQVQARTMKVNTLTTLKNSSKSTPTISLKGKNDEQREKTKEDELLEELKNDNHNAEIKEDIEKPHFANKIKKKDIQKNPSFRNSISSKEDVNQLYTRGNLLHNQERKPKIGNMSTKLLTPQSNLNSKFKTEKNFCGETVHKSFKKGSTQCGPTSPQGNSNYYNLTTTSSEICKGTPKSLFDKEEAITKGICEVPKDDNNQQQEECILNSIKNLGNLLKRSSYKQTIIIDSKGNNNLNLNLNYKDKEEPCNIIKEEPLFREENEKSSKSNVMSEKKEENGNGSNVNENSNIRLQRYEILLDFINTNIKEITDMMGSPEVATKNIINDQEKEEIQNVKIIQDISAHDKTNYIPECRASFLESCMNEDFYKNLAEQAAFNNISIDPSFVLGKMDLTAHNNDKTECQYDDDTGNTNKRFNDDTQYVKTEEEFNRKAQHMPIQVINPQLLIKKAQEMAIDDKRKNIVKGNMKKIKEEDKKNVTKCVVF